ncbi:MAG TPA: hypothetical protein VJ600_03465 [Holophagaceae bacterium]|nr:hypothetical protein [Holophagaceae bacterium]
MRPFHLAVPVFLAAAALSLAAQTVTLQPEQAAKTSLTHSVTLQDGSRLTLRNTTGRIKVVAWDRPEVVFTGVFKPSSEGEQAKVVFEPGEKNLEILGEFPKHAAKEDGYRSASCEMELKVPRGVLASIDNVNGRISLTGLDGSVDCRTVNGAIEAEDLNQGLTAMTTNGALALTRVRGAIHASTTNGAVSAKGLDGMGQGIELSTVNGAMNVTLAKREGTLLASTENGELSVDTEGATEVKATKHRVEATFPGRSQTIHVSTVNGGLVLK